MENIQQDARHAFDSLREDKLSSFCPRAPSWNLSFSSGRSRDECVYFEVETNASTQVEETELGLQDFSIFLRGTPV